MAISYGTYTITEVQEGSQIWSTTVAPKSPNYTFTISNLTGDSETSVKAGDIIMYSYYRYTVLSVSADGTTVLAGNRVSIRGGTGASAVTHSLIVSNLAIVKNKNGDISPASITLTAKSQTGSSAMVDYAGRFKIETTTDNSNWTVQYTSSANESTTTWDVIDDIIAIRCSLYLKDGTTTLLDQQTIPVISDGIDGTNITITSTSVTYQKGTSGTVKPTGTWETGVQSVGQGEYLWTRTIVNYSDGSSTEAYSVSRNAVNGTNGTNGKDGTSPTVSSTVTEYAQSTNGTTPPTSGWDTTPKTATAGQYMWTKVTVTYSDSATAVSYTVSKNGTNGTNGTNGINTATVYLYKKGTTAPSVPSGNTTYTFSTKKLTGTLDSWSQTIPTTGDGQCYVIAAVASSNDTTDTIATGEWSTPIQFNGTNGINGTNGTNGTNGLNQATIFLYKRGTSVTKPTTSVTYTFSTGALSAEPNSWKRNIPTIDGNPCWIISATAIGTGTSVTITGDNWSAPVKLVEDGSDGDDAYSVVLTNENHTFAGNSTSALASEMECNVIAYKGTTQVAATIGTITGQPTGMTTSLINNGTTNAAFSVSVTTSMVTKNGVLNIPITVDGKDFTKKFTYSLALDGVSVTNVTSTNNTTDGGTSVVTITMSDGTQKTFNVKNGNKGSTGDTAEWFYGTALTHKSGTATATITGAVVGSMYLNTETSLVYKCTNINGSTMTWTYAGDLTTGVINNIEIGGRNLLYKTGSSFYPVTGTFTGYYTEFTVSSTRLKNAITLEKDVTYTLSLDITSSVEPFSISVGVGNGGYSKDIVKIDNVYSGRKSITFSPTEAQLANGAIFAFRAPRYTSSTTFTCSVNAIKLEKGNIATDWTPAPEDIEEEVSNLRTDLQAQIDEKIQTYYQATAPSWSSVTDRTKHDGDLWYCTNDTGSYKKDRTYRYDSATNTWIEYSATSELFDRLDGKTTVYYGTTSGTYENVETGDYLVDGTDGSSYRWDGSKWVKVTDYQTAIDGIEDDIQDIQTNVSALQPELIIGTHGTTATTTWTGTSQNLSSNDIKSGTVIQYKLSSAGKANVTLNLTLKDNTTTGAVPVYYSNTTRLGTQYGINAIVTLVYDGSTTGGAWRVLNPYTNSTYNLANRTHATAIKALEAIAKQKLICGDSNGYVAIGASKTFDLSYPILYATAAITANATSTSTCETYSSITYTTTGAIESGGANLIIYLKGTVSGNTFTIAPTNFFTTVEPTSENGFYYIPLGVMSSETAGNFVTSNRLFAYIDGAFQSVDIAATKVAVNYLSSDTTGIMVADMKDGQQTPSGILSGNNVFINNTSVNIRDGQSTLASFGIEGMQIGLNTETHTEQDYHSWKMIDKDGNIYAFVSDLRDEYGEATVTETAKINEATNWVETNFEISSIISVTVNGEAPESYQKRLPKLIDITPEPTDEDVVVVTYTSQSPELKAYTFGKRAQDSNIGGYSFVEGVNNVASGYASHAEGVRTTASGHDSHAEGLGTTASGDYSHAQNFYTTASSSCQTVVGRHNVDDTNNKYAFIVGNGNRNQSINKLDYANALGITWDGTMEIGGLMCGTLIEDSEPTKNPPTRTPIPLFKTVSWSGNSSDSWDNQVIPSNGEWYRYGFNIYQKGYRALGVVGFGAFNATSNPSNVTWCVVTKCYTWYNPDIITDDNHIGADTLDIYVWNQHQSQSAKVKISVRVLYIAESALVGVLEPGIPK